MDISRDISSGALPVPIAFRFDPQEKDNRDVGIGATTFFRFRRKVTIDRVVVRPDNGGHKADRVVVQTFSDEWGPGETVFEGPLRWDRDSAHLSLPKKPVAAVSLGCTRKYPVALSFDEHYPSPCAIPVGIFENVSWFGAFTEERVPEAAAPLCLEKGTIAPRSTGELRASHDSLFAHFASPWFRISFSLKRPRIAGLCWDSSGTGRLDRNFVPSSVCEFGGNKDRFTVAAGPYFATRCRVSSALQMGGRVDVEGQTVRYSGLHGPEGITVDAEFLVLETGMELRLVQHAEHDRPMLDADAWRLVFDVQGVYSLGTLAQPLDTPGRTGRTGMKGGWHATNQGTLTFEAVEGDPILQTRAAGALMSRTMAGIQLGARPEPDGSVLIRSGSHSCRILFRTANVEPVVQETSSAPVHAGFRRAWGSAFAFRPEAGGMSNNGFSINTTNCLWFMADMLPWTAVDAPLPPMTELVRWTLNLALRGGPGYACQIAQSHDSAPSQVISAARVQQCRPDPAWLAAFWPDIAGRIRFILDHMDEDGMYTSTFRDGISGKGVRSCNAWDTFCFGHHDGYSGTLAYRALHSGAFLSLQAGDGALAQKCREAAQRLKDSYFKDLHNPATGWLAGWRDAEGKLHDYCFAFINAMAIAFGLVDEDSARKIMAALERQRKKMQIDDFRYGMPAQFAPVPECDCSWHGRTEDTSWGHGHFKGSIPLRLDGADAFGYYTNGGHWPVFSGFYIEALNRTGFRDTAEQIADQMLESYLLGVFDGARNGTECFTPDGIAGGYEGTLVQGFHTLLSIGRLKGWIPDEEPVWWPPY